MTTTVPIPQPQHAMTITLPSITGHPLTCEAALSDAVLQGARAAMDRLGDPYKWMLIADPGELNRPVLPLLLALLDGAQSTANALAENSWNSFEPLDKDLAADLIKQCQQIIAQIDCATHSTAPKEVA